MSRVEFKVVLLGQKYGGKTCLIERYLNERFHDVPYQTTIGASFGAKQFSINGRSVTMGIWDTAGGERYETMCRIYYRGARAAVVCYDVTDSTSFEKAQFWVSELKKHEEHCKIYLCGTKTDLIDEEPTLRKANLTQIHRYARDINSEVFETSSKTGHNVKELFNKIAEDYQAQSSDGSACKSNGTLRLQSPGKKSGCCS